MPTKFRAETLRLSDTTRTKINIAGISSGIKIKADKNNAGPIFVGRDDVSNVNGFALYPSESDFFPIDNTGIIALIAMTNNDQISYFTV